jgi:hypothetical protein
MAVNGRGGCSFGSKGCTNCEPSDLSSPELSHVRESPSYSGRLPVRIAPSRRLMARLNPFRLLGNEPQYKTRVETKIHSTQFGSTLIR